MDCVGAVVFDWYNTLAAPNTEDFWPRIPELITAAGGTHDEGALSEWVADHPLEHEDHSTSEVSYRAWQRRRFVRLLEQSGVPEPQRSRLAEDIERVRYTRAFSIFADVGEVLTTMREAGLVLGICSNWDWDLERHLRHNEIYDLADFVVCSAIHGYRKPHPAVFDAVAARAALPRQEIVFVGDSLSDDVRGAATAGLRPVHIDRDGSCQPAMHAEVPCVPDLRTLLRLAV